MASFMSRVTSEGEEEREGTPVVIVTRWAALAGFSRKLHSRQQLLPSLHADHESTSPHTPASKNGSFFAFSAALKKSSAAFYASSSRHCRTL